MNRGGRIGGEDGAPAAVVGYCGYAAITGR